MHIEPFQISVSDVEIDDLRRRLRNTRWASMTPSEPWQQGTEHAWLREWVTHWAESFDWRAAEHGMNQQPQFMARQGSDGGQIESQLTLGNKTRQG